MSRRQRSCRYLVHEDDALVEADVAVHTHEGDADRVRGDVAVGARVERVDELQHGKLPLAEHVLGRVDRSARALLNIKCEPQCEPQCVPQ